MPIEPNATALAGSSGSSLLAAGEKSGRVALLAIDLQSRQVTELRNLPCNPNVMTPQSATEYLVACNLGTWTGSLALISISASSSGPTDWRLKVPMAPTGLTMLQGSTDVVLCGERADTGVLEKLDTTYGHLRWKQQWQGGAYQGVRIGSAT
ncbi:MAG: hypothetical protein WAV54_13425 [Acidimicrobiales bacterium]